MRHSARLGSVVGLVVFAGAMLVALPTAAFAQEAGDPSLFVPDPADLSDFGSGLDQEAGRARFKETGSYFPRPKTAQLGKEADLLLSSELDPAVSPGTERVSNPDIAVGPDDIIVVAGQNRIMRLPNPNANGSNLPYTGPSAGAPGIPSPQTNLNALRAGVPTSEIFLDTWVGSAVLSDVCPGTFDPKTCLIQYPTVRYDQMHGHFLVAFTITDTGVRGLGTTVSVGRASTWVLLVSRKPTFVNPDGSVPPQVFSAPATPPDVVPPGGLTADWYIYYGSRDTAGPTGFLNLNMYSTHSATRPLATPGRYSASFPESNCNAPAGNQPPLSVSAPANEETVCLFPTELRMGIDGDSVVLVSPVFNVNQIVPNSNTIPFTSGRYAGNRVRILSKYQLYNFAGNFSNGNAFSPGNYFAPTPYSGDVIGAGLNINGPQLTQWDLFRDRDLPAFCSVFDFASNTCTVAVAGFPPRRYTLGHEVSPTGSGIDTPRPPATPTTLSSMYPLYYEPVHVRGRAMAKYSNYPYGGFTNLVGSYAFGTIGSGGHEWVQPIVYRPDYRPALDGGDETAIGIEGPRRLLTPDTVINPLQVLQSVACSTAPCSGGSVSDPQNLVYVGDSRPRRAIYREGHIFDARTSRPSSGVFGTSIETTGPNNANTANSALWSTVYYDVIQTIYTSATPPLPGVGTSIPMALPMTNPSLTFYSFWQNGHFFAPMFDVTANVQPAGVVSPSSSLSLLEKLFVGTTSPRVGLPNTVNQGNIWPSLFDIRQGIDKFDRFDYFRDPVTGRVINPLTAANTLNVFATRAGASTDPNGGGLWTYGAFSDSRISSVGQWATHAAYYPMTFSATDAYGTPTNSYADVCPVGQSTPTCLADPFFVFIEIARKIGLTKHLFGPGGASLEAGRIDPGHGLPGNAIAFQSTRKVTRAEMASFIVYSTMDEAAVDDYLTKTTGASPFTDVFAGAGGVDPDGQPGVLTAAQAKAIEVLARRGYTAGCSPTTFCPFNFVTRGQMAVFMVKAKENNVHPTVIPGCAVGADPFTCTAAGDNFWILQQTIPYFPGDVPATNPFFPYIQKLRELRITGGTGPGLFSPNATLTRGQVATFAVKAFHF